jgi:glycolate oxidase
MPSPLIPELRALLGRSSVLAAPSELAVYDCDALTVERRRPTAVALPSSTEQVVEIVKCCRRHGAAIVPRGAGTSLAGGCLPLAAPYSTQNSCGSGVSPARCDRDDRTTNRDGGQCIVVSMTRMNKIIGINARNRMAEVQSGVTNLRLAAALAGTGLHFAPDPSSEGASTIGGNLSTNAGGPHTLKYGVTVNHVLGLEAVLADGSILQLGPTADPPGLDLLGTLIGSEGTLALITKAWVRLTPNPQDRRAMRAAFVSLDAAAEAVSGIIAAGIIPAAMELMDRGILAAVDDAFHFGFPPDAGAVLIVEIDGPTVGLERRQRQIVEICRQHGAGEVLQAATAAERELLWKCRKLAVGATGRLSPSYMIQDGVVPRTRLPEIIRRAAEIGVKHRIRIVNVAHAGDGNIHPILLFDERDRDEVARAMAAGHDILEACIAAGGSITAEHGIGIEKLALMPRQFAPADLEAMRRVRRSFDPTGMFNPGKLLPAR